MKKHTLKWFIARIGKQIYRKDTNDFPITIATEAHAKTLEMYQNDLELYYSDKPFNKK